jgi:hypothetical protein
MRHASSALLVLGLAEDSLAQVIDGHVPGGLPIITDAAFSLVILVYVSIAFCVVFFMFCWNSDSNGKQRKCALEEGVARRMGVAQPVVIPPTPSKEGSQHNVIELTLVQRQ